MHEISWIAPLGRIRDPEIAVSPGYHDPHEYLIADQDEASGLRLQVAASRSAASAAGDESEQVGVVGGRRGEKPDRSRSA
jgi:hypothetical protein